MKYTIQTTCTIGNHTTNIKLDAFKVLTDDFNIIIFVTTASVKEKLNIDSEPQGQIRGVNVVDIQQLLNDLESADHPVFDVLAADFDTIQDLQPEELGYVTYEQVKGMMPTLPSHVQLDVLKLSTQSMSEDCYISQRYYTWLRQKYYKNRGQSQSKNRRGFAA